MATRYKSDEKKRRQQLQPQQQKRKRGGGFAIVVGAAIESHRLPASADGADDGDDGDVHHRAADDVVATTEETKESDILPTPSRKTKKKKKKVASSGSKSSSLVCPSCGRSGFETPQAYGSHRNSCVVVSSAAATTSSAESIPRKSSSLTLRPDALSEEAKKLSNFNQMLVSSIDLFEADDLDVERQHRGGGKRSIRVDDVGIRCRHCRASPTSGSVHYPKNLKTLPHNVYVIADRHLIGGSCTKVATDYRGELRIAKKRTTSESLRKGGLGLPTYLGLVCDHYGLEDSEGVRRRRRPSTTDK